MLNKNLLFFIFLPGFFYAHAQVEVVNDLQYNAVIKQYLKNNSASTENYKKASSTIQLPFRDDFSLNTVYPDAIKWSDNFAFINNTFPINPVTVGVATLDGADQYGNPYNPTNPNAHGIADSLTSQPINLDYPGDTTIYLSFYYQPQGRGNAPENVDSLVLEFEDNLGNWNHVWSKAGSTNHPFQLVMINITDPVFLFDGFRFRFKNYATLSGQTDHWHIDYVLLDRLRHFADTVFDDMAFVDPAPFPLEFGLTSMPWQHFLVDPAFYLKDDISYQVRNLSNATRNVNFAEEIRDTDGTVTFNVNLGNQNIVGNSYYTQNVTLPPGIFPATATDSAEFIMKHIINTTPDINRNNDTLKHIQRFYNYYAYDDGTAEKAYGLQGSGNPGSPCFGCKMALEFTPAKPDTLQAVMIHFSQIAASVATNLFKLTVWSGLNPETIVYEEANLTPQYTDSVNGFAIFEIEPPLYITGTFYVGTVQDNHLLNIGLDVNRNTNAKMFYNSTGTWFTSSIDGTWMIRPVFGADLHISSVHENLSTLDFNFYPNPASEILYIQIPEVLTGAEVVIGDLTGREVLVKSIYNNQVSISSLPSGIYFLRIKDKKGNYSQTKKLVVNGYR
jgi:hypothetical protein